MKYIQQAVELGKLSGNGHFTQKCQRFFEERYQIHKCLLTSSCTDALEMAAILFEIQPGDEVILPSFTFVSDAIAFVRRGAKLRFVDSRSDHPRIDETKIEELITPKTKAILVVHYAGIPCEMDRIISLAQKHGLWVVEDAAQAIESQYKGKQLGTKGHLGTMSFHETKNIQCGEGGMLMINDPKLTERAEHIWEKGTNRAAFFRGEIDKYGWVDEGSSFLPSEVIAAFLWAQLEKIEEIQDRRKMIWEDYFELFTNDLPTPQVLEPDYFEVLKKVKFKMKNEWGQEILNSFIPNFKFRANGHIFYLLFPDLPCRTKYATDLKNKGILAVFHYQSLHKSAYAQKHFPEEYVRDLPNSDRYSDCLLRLPLYYELSNI